MVSIVNKVQKFERNQTEIQDFQAEILINPQYLQTEKYLKQKVKFREGANKQQLKMFKNRKI